MNTMKKSESFFIFLMLALFVSSQYACKDYLEQPEGSIITVDSVFNNPDNAMRALWNVYATSVVNGFITGDGGSGLSDA